MNKFWEMTKFWKWMEEKGYGDKYRDIIGSDGDHHAPTKQMLIGYMIEYVMTELKISIDFSPLWKFLDFDILYNGIKTIIDEKEE